MLVEQSYLLHVTQEVKKKEGIGGKGIAPIACVFFLGAPLEVSNTSQSEAYQLRSKLSCLSVVWEGGILYILTVYYILTVILAFFRFYTCWISRVVCSPFHSPHKTVSTHSLILCF